jgi:hypothetical protein
VSALRHAYDGKKPAKAARKSMSRPFVLVLTIGILAALWLMLDPGAGTDTGTDPGADAGTDAATDADAATATATATDPDPLSPHEREEAAKDALSRARTGIEAGDTAAAAEALDTAEALDPGNPDIAELRAKLGISAPDASTPDAG